jgi:peroxiredoxin
MLNVGDKVPDFTLPLAFADGKKDPVGFHQFLQASRGPVVIGFFPLAFTGMCTKEMCEFRDRQAVFDHVDAKAVGFSADTPQSLVEFAKQNQLKHGIFADPNHKVLNELWDTAVIGGVASRAKRGWMVVMPDGKVAEKWVSEDPSVWSGIEPINAALHKAAPHRH